MVLEVETWVYMSDGVAGGDLPILIACRRDALLWDTGAATGSPGSQRPREQSDPLQSAPQPKQPLILMQNVRGGGNESLHCGAEPGNFSAMK